MKKRTIVYVDGFNLYYGSLKNSSINQQIDYQEDLMECLSKAESLTKVALSNDFLDCSDEIKHNYL